jgi:two-component system response regulator AtoC
MVRIRQQILQIAPVDVPVFVCGESGVGKEVVARMIHLRSKRRTQPFVKVNCAALPGELLESELFGFEQGAFTGAVRAKPGKFEMANKGTIFLDEIAEMSPLAQVKILHVLEYGEFERLGSERMLTSNARIISATNCSLRESIRQGKFREDLFHRLNGLTLLIPALRERMEELPALIAAELKACAADAGKKITAIHPEAMQKLLVHPWPGNLRELEIFVKRFLVFGDEVAAVEELAGDGNPAALAGVARHLSGDVQHAQVRCVGLAHAGEGVEGAGAGAGDAGASVLIGGSASDRTQPWTSTGAAPASATLPTRTTLRPLSRESTSAPSSSLKGWAWSSSS